MKGLVALLFFCFAINLVLCSLENDNHVQNHHLKEKSEHNHHHLHEKSEHHHNFNEKSEHHHHFNAKSEHKHHSGRHHHQKLGDKHHQHQGLSHLLHRQHHGYKSQDQHCRWVCIDVRSNDSSIATGVGVEIFYNSSSSLFAVEIATTHYALVIDYSLNVILLINGQSGVTIIINLSSQQVIRVPQSPETQYSLWISSKLTFKEYFEKISVQNLLQLGQQFGEKGQLTNLPETIAKEIETNFQSLGIPLPPTEVFKLLTNFSGYLKSVLSFIYKGAGSLQLPHQFKWFLKFNVLLANLLNPANSGIDLSKIHVEPRSIFNGSSGIESFVNIFSQLGHNVDLSRIGTNILSSRETILKFLGDVSSGSHNGLDGLVTVVVNVVKFLNGIGSINDVITSIIKYNGTGVDEPTYSQVINGGLELLRAQVSTYPNGQIFTPAIKFLEALTNNNLVLNEVNICDIIKILFSPNPFDRIHTIVKILYCFAPQRGIPQFFKFIAEICNGTGNNSLISELLPGVNISSFIGNGNILQNILQGRNLTQLLSGGNISSALSGIPIFGPIASRIEGFFKQQGESLEKYLNPNHFIELFTGGLHNLTSGGGFGNLFGIGGNSNQSSNPADGFISNIQDTIGSFFGLGNSEGHTESPPPSPIPNASSNSSQTSSETPADLVPVSGNLSLNGNGSTSDESSEIGNISATLAPSSVNETLLPNVNTTEKDNTHEETSVPNSTVTENVTGGINLINPNPFGLRGSLEGSISGALSLGEKHKVHRRNKKSFGKLQAKN